jgi:heptosyltransferase I
VVTPQNKIEASPRNIAETPSRKKIVLIRLDKIGDLICSLPVDQVLDKNEYDVTWIVQKGMGQVVDLGSRKRKYFELDKNDPKTSAQKLAQILKEIHPDIAISFQAPWWVGFELFKARIPVRSGVRSQWHSFLFLNQGLRQKRSLAVKHELDYNLDLILHTLKQKPSREFLFFEIAKPNTTEVLEKFRLKPQDYVVVHPGMMGSALNWKQSQYIEYIHQLIQNPKQVVITGTPSDEPYLTDIKKEFAENPCVKILQSQLNMNELVQVLAHAEFVVAPSTGVAHLAASVGTRTLAIFSPIRVHHPRRWSPRGPRVEIYLPQVECPVAHQCLKEQCIHFNCMDRVVLPLVSK